MKAENIKKIQDQEDKAVEVLINDLNGPMVEARVKVAIAILEFINKKN